MKLERATSMLSGAFSHFQGTFKHPHNYGSRASNADMPLKAPDAVDQLKKAFKGLFGKKKAKKEETAPTATTEQPTASTSKPTETTPAAPAPATAPEPAKSEAVPASTGTTPVAQPAAAPVDSEPKKDETAVLAEVKQATQSRLTSLYPTHTGEYDDYLGDGSRRRQKVALDNDWRDGPL
jgi:hypothetical protein